VKSKIYYGDIIKHFCWDFCGINNQQSD